jgi:hypothetical protein
MSMTASGHGSLPNEGTGAPPPIFFINSRPFAATTSYRSRPRLQ